MSKNCDQIDIDGPSLGIWLGLLSHQTRGSSHHTRLGDPPNQPRDQWHISYTCLRYYSSPSIVSFIYCFISGAAYVPSPAS